MLQQLKDFLWSPIRYRLILRKQAQVAGFWRPRVSSYYAGELDIPESRALRPELVGKKIIWQYWGQGLDAEELPAVVSVAMQSVDKYKGDWQVIRLSDDTIGDYLALPDFVYQKMANSAAFRRVFFSDLLRLSLLYHYGGGWLDATVLLSQPLDDRFLQSPYFMYQRSMQAEHKRYWMKSYAAYWGWASDFRVRVLNAIFFASKEANENLKYSMIEDLYKLMLHYWQTEDQIVDYFFFQVLYDVLYREEGRYLGQCVPDLQDDTLPHLLHNYINGAGASWIDLDKVFDQCGIHKLTYFTPEEMMKLKRELRQRDIL